MSECLYTYFYSIKFKKKYVYKMVSIAMMIGGAVVNAFAFSGYFILFSSLKSSDAEKERKRHDLALEQLTKARDEWSKERLKYLDYMNDQLRKEANAKKLLPI